MTSGTGSGTSGTRRWPAWAIAYAVIAAATLFMGTVNVLSVLDERDWIGRPIEWWQPAVWEGTSGIVLMALAWIPLLAVRHLPLSGRRWPLHLAGHFGLTIIFSVAHVALMVALRQLLYALAGESYELGDGWDPWLYEYRKDVISYALYAGTFWLTARLVGETPARAAEPEAERATPAAFVIDEGSRLLRVAPADILAVRSSGNYVEFLLDDGRRPLMRATLAAVGEQLAGEGFVRTHRSWIVNRTRVAQIAAEGSGDYGLTLDDGSRIPLSRRYREALEALRQTG